MKFAMGQSVRRIEDAALVRGQGSYTADLAPDNALHALVLRSPYAHADFTIGSLEAALAVKGVKLIYTAKDLAHVKPVPCQSGLRDRDGGRIADLGSRREVLCASRVRHVGDPVAFIVATSLDAARDAAESIAIEWRPLPAVTDMTMAAQAGAPLVWEQRPGNVAGRVRVGDPEKVAAAFAAAAKVVTLELDNNRLVTNYMEPRVALGDYAVKNGFTLTLSSQGSHGIRDTLCAMMDVEPARLRVITPEVGGAFGTKAFMYPEYPLVLLASQHLRRPVLWVQDRSEHFISCAQGRDNLTRIEGAFSVRGRLLALRISNHANMGAYLSQFGPTIPYLAGMMTAGPYDVPAYCYDLTLFHTHTVPVDAYRGAGRPEAAYFTERFMDFAASELHMDPQRLRRLNFIKPRQMPYKTPVGRVIDSGDFASHLERALEAIDARGFRARERAARRRGRMLGLGYASYIEACGGGGAEHAWARLESDGSITLLVGSQNNGQGHKTAYAHLAAMQFGVAPEQIRVIQGDTDLVPRGSGTGGSRALPVGGVAVEKASALLVTRMKHWALAALEAGEGDLELSGGAVRIKGTDRAITFAALAQLPEAKGQTEVGNAFTPAESTYPNGTHAVEVEVDPDTGHVEIVAYVVVDDFGVALNPLLLEGQVHGGIGQGIGQAMMERTVYDDRGQLLSASPMDYALPRARDLPSFEFEMRNVPCRTNPLGVKGAGEAGAIGSCPAVINAIVNALSPLGIRHIDMPATSEAIWNAIQVTRRAKVAQM